MRSRILALVLAAVLVVGSFAGCGNTPASSTPNADPTPTVEPTVDPTEAPAETTTVKTFDYDAAYAAYDPDAIVLTVNGKEITWHEYFGWIYTMVEQLEMYLGTEFNWSDAFSETENIQEYACSYAETMSSQYSVITSKAEEQNLTLGEEGQAQIDEAYFNDVANYGNGSEAEFEEYLNSTYMTVDYYYYINSAAVFYQLLFSNAYGEQGANFSDEDVAKFIEENGFLHAKHILFKTVDDAGSALEESAITEKKAQAEETLAKLRAIKDQDELLEEFDSLMNELGEDPGVASYPNGYFFGPGEMVTEFEEGTKALENYAVSDIIETSYGYHIILRLPITPDDNYNENANFRYLAAAQEFDVAASEWFSSAEIVYTEEFSEMDFSKIFNIIEVEA